MMKQRRRRSLYVPRRRQKKQAQPAPAPPLVLAPTVAAQPAPQVLAPIAAAQPAPAPRFIAPVSIILAPMAPGQPKDLVLMTTILFGMRLIHKYHAIVPAAKRTKEIDDFFYSLKDGDDAEPLRKHAILLAGGYSNSMFRPYYEEAWRRGTYYGGEADFIDLGPSGPIRGGVGGDRHPDSEDESSDDEDAVIDLTEL